MKNHCFISEIDEIIGKINFKSTPAPCAWQGEGAAFALIFANGYHPTHASM